MTGPKATPDGPPTLSRYAWRCIRQRAAWLVGRPGVVGFDREDIEQELAVRLWQGLRNFDPAKGSTEAFIATVLRRAGNSLLRRRSSRRRGAGRVHHSLERHRRPDGDLSFAEDASVRLTTPVGADQRAVDLTHDVAVVLDELPDELRELAEQLQRHSVTEITQRMALSRSTIYVRIQQLRQYFVAAGLKESV